MSTAIDLRPEELAAVAAELLDGLLGHLLVDPAGKPREFLIFLHAKNLLRLAQDVIFLESYGRGASTPTIARAMLESLFKLGVAVKNPDLAAQRTLLEFEWEYIQQSLPGSRPREIDKIRQKKEYGPISQRIETLSKRWGFPAKEYLAFKKFSTWEWAKAAGLDFLYAGRYAELSNYSHAVSTSLMFTSVPAYVLAVVTVCLLEASERVGARFKKDIPEDLHERTVALRKAFMACHKTGQYLQLF